MKRYAGENRMFVAAAAAIVSAMGWTAEASAWTAGPPEPTRGGLIDLPMYDDPAIDEPAVEVTFHPRLKPLWLRALQRPETELRRQAAEAFATAVGRGMTGFDEVVPALLDRLSSDEEPAVRLAVAEALAAIDDPSAADALLAAGEHGGVGMMLVTDAALARWQHAAANEVWITRAGDADAPAAARLSAIEALGRSPAPAAVQVLSEIVGQVAERSDLRLAAAETLAVVARHGLVPLADTLAAGNDTDRLLAAALLAGHRGTAAPEATQTLLPLTNDTSPTVAARAVASLNAIDTSVIAGEAQRLVRHNDPRVRGGVVEALHAQPSPSGVDMLGRMLADPIPTVRHAARRALFDIATEPGLEDAVKRAADGVLGGGDWRGLEQAAILVGQLRHDPAAERLVALMRHERPETRLAATAALREVAAPRTLPAMLERAEQLSEARSASADGQNLIPSGYVGWETAQLFQAFGQMGFREAIPLMRRYIPKNSGFSGDARGAALYALGKLHEVPENGPDPDLIRQFASRLSDVDPMNPESTEVRRFAAIGLGRMNASGQLNTLRRFLEEEGTLTDVGGACRWAIERITGESLPPLETVRHSPTGWFLEPMN
jgi:HEAT repeat protein